MRLCVRDAPGSKNIYFFFLHPITVSALVRGIHTFFSHPYLTSLPPSLQLALERLHYKNGNLVPERQEDSGQEA